MSKSGKQFDLDAEQSYYDADSAAAVASPDLDRLAVDMQNWVPDLPGIFAGAVVLDLGAGKAPVGTVIAGRFCPQAVVSLELVHKRLLAAHGKQRILRALSLVCGNVFNLPFPDNTFDYVVANSVLHHLPRLEQAAAEIARVMRPGAYYLGREPNFNNPLVRWGVFKFAGTPLFPGSHSNNEYPLRSQEIVAAFTRAGCRCEMHYFWRRLPRLHHPILSAAISVRIQRLPQPSFVREIRP